MLNLSTKRKLKGWFYSRSALFLLFALVVLMFMPVLNMHERYSESRALLSVSQERMDNLLDQEVRLEEDIRYLKSDLGREAEIRKSFGAGKEGEFMAVVMEAEGRVDTNDGEEKKGAWIKIKKWFGGKFD